MLCSTISLSLSCTRHALPARTPRRPSPAALDVTKSTSTMELYRETSAVPFSTHADDSTLNELVRLHFTTPDENILRKFACRDNIRRAVRLDELKWINPYITEMSVEYWNQSLLGQRFYVNNAHHASPSNQVYYACCGRPCHSIQLPSGCWQIDPSSMPRTPPQRRSSSPNLMPTEQQSSHLRSRRQPRRSERFTKNWHSCWTPRPNARIPHPQGLTVCFKQHHEHLTTRHHYYSGPLGSRKTDVQQAICRNLVDC